MKKRLLLVTCGYPFGESERGFLTEEAKFLASRFDLMIMALDNQDPLLYPTDGILHIERYRFSSFRQTRQIHALPHVFEPATLREAWDFIKEKKFSDPVAKLRRTLYYRFNVWEMEQQIGRLIAERKIDIVYTYWCDECTVAAVKLKRRFPDLKVVTRFHGMDLYEERTPESWQFFRKEIARHADVLCFACAYGRRYFQQHWGSKYANKMHLSYLGSADRGFLDAPVTERLRIVSCSNVIALKRVDLIIEALVLLPDSIQVEWNHFGDGNLREQLEKLAEERLRNHPNIRWKFQGFIPNAVLTQAYKKIEPNLFITTSSTEGGAPVSIQEAFSMGIPAIGTPIGGIPDLVVDAQTGFLLPDQAEASDVAAAITKFAALPDDRKRQMAASARQLWKEKFDAKENADKFTAYLRNLISEQEVRKA